MRLDLSDTLALLDRLLEKEPQTSKPGGFTVRLRRLRELLAETNTAEPTLAAIAGFVFPGVSQNSLRTTLLAFRKSLTEAASAAGQQIELIRPDARGVDAGEVICHFEGLRLPFVFDTSMEETALSRENEVIEPRARATKIFVSFAMKDLPLSHEFTDLMKTNLPLRCAEPVQLWRFDGKDGILPGENNEAIIRQQMDESQFGILLVSPDYLASQFIQRVELPHFIGENARAHPIPVALSDFTPGQDKHELLNPTNVFSHKGKDFAHTPKKDRPDFVKALCDRIAVLISTRSTLPKPSAKDFAQLCPELRKEDGLYIPNRGRTERSLGKSAGKPDDDSNESSVPVLETLQAWMDDPADSAYMAVLGEAGAGKTMTCSKLAHSLNAKHPSRCIYIDLRHLNESGLLKTQSNPTLEEILAAILGRSTSHEKVTPERVLQAVREQGALLIWDGLDEVLAHLSAEEGDAFFKQLKEALPPRLIRNTDKTPGRVLIACRTHYFRSFEHEASTLTQAQRGPVHANAPEDQRARFRVLRLLPFDDDQIHAYLAANVPGLDLERALDVIHRVHNLHDLAQRPYCLSLMRNSLPDLDRTLAAGKKVRSVDLYRSLVRSWLARDNTKHRFDEDDKPRLMSSLAAWMWREGAKSLTAERLGQWLKETIIADPTFRAMYGDSFKETKRRDELLQDFRTATFIARWDGDSFRFAHTSLQEYFLATALVTALETGDADEWLIRRVNHETLDFAAELFLQRAEESPAARTRLEQNLARLLAESVPGRSENALAFYLRLHATGESSWVPTKLDLRNLDFTAWEFIGTAEITLLLPSANFSGAKLIRARFNYVEMPDSRWAGTDLCSAEFFHCGLTHADFSGGNEQPTRLDGALFRSCRLSGNSISGVTTHGIRLQLSIWDVDTEAGWRAEISAQQKAPSIVGEVAPLPNSHQLFHANAHWSFLNCYEVNDAAYSPDGRNIVSGSWDQFVRLWDTESGQCLRVLPGNASNVNCVAFSPDGHLVAGGTDRNIQVWDVKSGELLCVLSGNDSMITTVTFSPDGKKIISGGWDKIIHVWDLPSSEYDRSLIGHDNEIRSLAFSPDGRRTVSASWDKAIRVWAVDGGECVSVLEGHTSGVRSVAFSSDSRLLVSGSDDHTIRIWNAENGKCLRILKGHHSSVMSVAFSPDDSRIVSGSWDTTIRIWDVDSGESRIEFETCDAGVKSVAFSPDGLQVLSAAWEGGVRVWDAANGDCLRILGRNAKPARRLYVSPDHRSVLAEFNDGAAKILDASLGTPLVTHHNEGEIVNLTNWTHDPNWTISPFGTILVKNSNGSELDIASLPDGGYAVLEKASGETCWRLVRAKGEYWRYVNYATDGPEGRVLWSADVLGAVPEV